MLHLSLDIPYALEVAEHSKTRQHTVVVGPEELLGNLLVPLLAHDVPAMGQMEASLYLLFQRMKKDATVALSGESADEVFGGYPWFFDDAAVNTPTFPWMAMLKGRTVGERAVFSADLVEKIRPEEYIADNYERALSEVPRLSGESAFDARRREVFYFNITRFLPLLLDRKDRMSMACGFEVRVPFCDYQLVEYVWNIPWSMKMVGDIEKGVLREALAPFLPESVARRRKSPYPATQDPIYAAGVRKWAKEILNDRSAPLLPLLNVEALRKGLEGNVEGPAMFALAPLERIIQINAWLKDYRVQLC